MYIKACQMGFGDGLNLDVYNKLTVVPPLCITICGHIYVSQASWPNGQGA